MDMSDTNIGEIAYIRCQNRNMFDPALNNILTSFIAIYIYISIIQKKNLHYKDILYIHYSILKTFARFGFINLTTYTVAGVRCDMCIL